MKNISLLLMCTLLSVAGVRAADGDVAEINVLDDSFVQDGGSANTNFNSDERLVVKNDGVGFHRQTYLKFVVPADISADQIGKARISLRLRGANTGIASVSSWVIYYVDDDTWSETSLTWSNKPVADYEIVRVPTVGTNNANVQIPITGKLKAEIAKDRILSVCIDGSNAVGTGDVSFYSKESTDHPEYLPRLILSSEVDPTEPEWVEPVGPELLELEVAESIINRIRADKMERDAAALEDAVDSWIGAMQSDGSFSDVDYVTSERSEWAAIDHLLRLKEMGIAYTKEGCKYFEDDVLYAKIVKGYESWFNKKPHNTLNWWHNRISHPRNLGEALIAAYPGKKKITEEPVFKKLATYWRESLGRPDSPNDATTAGANKCDIAMHWIYRSCLTRNREDLAFAAEQSFIPVSQVTGEGIQHDWSYRQHGAQLYLAGYGYEFIQLVTRQASYLVGTPYALSGEKLNILSSYARNTYLKTIRGARLHYNIFGRSITRENATLQTSIIPVLQMLGEIDAEYAGTYEAAIKRIRKEESASYAIQPSQTHYYRGEYTIQQRPEYSFDVRMASSRMARSEYDIYENTRGFFLTDGATTVTVDGEEYGSTIPFWSWTKIPGTTLPALDSAHMVRADSYIRYGRSNYAGGVTDGLHGVTAFEVVNNEALYRYNDDTGWGGTPSPQGARLPALDFGAKKSWFIFDGEIVCLGAGIRSGHDEVMQTTVNQCRQAGDLIVSANGAEVQPGEGTHSYAKVDWVLNDKVAYFFPDRDSLFVANQTKSGTWKDVNLSFATDAPITGKLFTLWKEHGVKPLNAKYAYIIVPNVSSAEEVKRYDPSHVQVIVNSDSLQVVYNRRLKMYGCAFFKAGGFKTSSGLTVEADNGCVVLIKNVDADTVTVYVADPQKQGAPINLGIETPKVQGRKLVTYENPAAPHQGKSLEFKVSNLSQAFPGRNVALGRSGWTVTTSHTGPTDATVGGDNPNNIIDGNNVTSFLFVKPGKTLGGVTVGASEESWFAIDLQQPQEMAYLLYRHRTESNTSALLRATQASFYGRNEPSEEWTPVIENFAISTAADEVKVDFPGSVSYRYVRLVFKGWDAASGNTIQVSEFNLGAFSTGEDSFEEIPVDTSTVRYEATVAAGTGVSVVTPAGSGPYSVVAGSTFVLTFTLDENYENPQVTVNSALVTPSLADGVYAVTIPSVAGDLTVDLSATAIDDGETPNDPPLSVDGADLSDPVVAVTYYNLQGQKIRKPDLTGIYIVKKVHASKKVVAKKELIVKH
ncbi:MAG: DNRLRE domain-containing protein [Prevotellaceae bacterium]|jgi:chondroitin AC lyase|nr:DNRLRE domain-containing protein [Prevotellaceae bacterium]